MSFGAAHARRREQGIKSYPAAVRNTRRSISDTPYLPLTLVAPPPELHHFAKEEIAAGRPAADVVRRGARTPARARDKELSRRRAQHPAIDQRHPVPAADARRPTARAPSFR